MKKLSTLLLGLILASQLVWAGLPPTTSKVSGDSNDVTTFKYQFPNFAGTHTGTTVSLGILGTAGGGTGNSTGTATNATNGTTVSTSANASFFPLFAASSSNGNQPFNLGTGLTFNPSTNLLALASGGLFQSTNSTEIVQMGMSSSNRFTLNNSSHAGETFLTYATNSTFIGLGIGTFSNDWPLSLNESSTDTAPLTSLVPSAALISAVDVRNTSATANNYSALVFSGSTDKMTSAIVGVHEVHTAGSETGHLEFLVNNAATKSRAMKIGADKTLTLDGYASGYLKTSSTGVVSTAQDGLKNYIVTNPGIESNATTGYSLGHAALTNGILTGSPTFGSGAAGTLSIAPTGTTPISDTYSLNYVSSNATTAGDFVATDAFTVDPEGQAKPLQFKISYQASVNPTNGNFSGTSSNSFGVALYDVTNSAWLGCSGNFNVVQSSGVGLATGNCQTAITTASARLVFYNVSASSGAITMKLDNFFYGPQITAQGPAITDWKNDLTFTPSAAFGTVSASSTWNRRVGDSLEVSGYWTNGTVSGSTASIGLPASIRIDSAKEGSTSNSVALGSCGVNASGSTAAASPSLFAFYDGSDTANVYFTDAVTTPGFAKVGGTGHLSTGGGFPFCFKIPVAGWSSNTVMSNDTDTRVVDFSATKGSTQSVTANTTDITFTSVKDSHGAWSGSSFAVPVSGDYVIGVNNMNDNGSTKDRFDVYINGSAATSGSIAQTGAAAASQANGVGLFTGLKANDTISIRCDQTTTLAAQGRITILRLSGPATIAASESVSAQYNSSSTSFATNATTDVVMPTKDWDTHGQYNTSTGVYTVQSPGTYQVSCNIYPSANVTASGVGGRATLNLYKNAVDQGIFAGFVFQQTSTAVTVELTGSKDVRALSGDALKVSVTNTSLVPTWAANGNSSSWCSIKRTGN